jgi:saccharopine dehydrogenase-like NADP-dependent oxidoreductase
VPRKHKISILGAGRIGEALAVLLSESGDYDLLIADHQLQHVEQLIKGLKGCRPFKLEVSDKNSLKKIASFANTVISALPFHLNLEVAKCFIPLGVNYFDLTEDVATTNKVTQLAKNANCVVMPQAGLAPGYISIIASHLFKKFYKVEQLKLRVGALPVYPSNQLKYNLTWSSEGLINEYLHPCKVIRDGQLTSAQPLEGLERFSLDGSEYEAFNTSGGLGSLCETLHGKINNLDYKSIRLPGHRDLMSFLLKDLKFSKDTKTLISVLERSIGFTTQDKCIVLVEAVGMINDRLVQETFVSTIYGREINGKRLSAIQLSTAAGLAGPLDLILSGKLGKRKGLINAEEIPLDLLHKNRFGKFLKTE